MAFRVKKDTNLLNNVVDKFKIKNGALYKIQNGHQNTTAVLINGIE